MYKRRDNTVKYDGDGIDGGYGTEIYMLNEKLGKIKENTTWPRRTIITEIITVICTGVTGDIALFYESFTK